MPSATRGTQVSCHLGESPAPLPAAVRPARRVRLSLILEISSSPFWEERAPLPSPPRDLAGRNEASKFSPAGCWWRFSRREKEEHMTKISFVCQRWEHWNWKKNQEMLWINVKGGLPRWLSGKEFAYNAEDTDLIPGSGRSPGEGWQCTPVFLPGESHGQRNPVGYHPWGHKELAATEGLNKNDVNGDPLVCRLYDKHTFRKGFSYRNNVICGI